MHKSLMLKYNIAVAITLILLILLCKTNPETVFLQSQSQVDEIHSGCWAMQLISGAAGGSIVQNRPTSNVSSVKIRVVVSN